MLKIIGISGKRESGKSSLAKFMTEYGYTRVSLANPLKEMCKALYNLNDEQVYGKDKETPTIYKRSGGEFLTPRDILIREGCLKRSIDPNFWCRLLAQSIENDYFFDEKFVIDDIRFLNEITYFKKFGAKFVRLERSQSSIGKAALDDLSETELDSYKDWDGILLETFNRNLNDLKLFADYVDVHI